MERALSQEWKRQFGKEGYPTSLEDMLERTGLGIQNCAHVALDLQRLPVYGVLQETIAQHVGSVIAPTFNKLRIPTYLVYDTDYDKAEYKRSGQKRLKSLDQEGGFYDSVRPLPGDYIVGKANFSAFSSVEFNEALQKNDKKIILLDGLECNVCVLATAYDACKYGYGVVLLEDGTDLQTVASNAFGRASAKAKPWYKQKTFCPGLITEPSENVFKVLRSLAKADKFNLAYEMVAF